MSTPNLFQCLAGTVFITRSFFHPLITLRYHPHTSARTHSKSFMEKYIYIVFCRKKKRLEVVRGGLFRCLHLALKYMLESEKLKKKTAKEVQQHNLQPQQSCRLYGLQIKRWLLLRTAKLDFHLQLSAASHLNS